MVVQRETHNFELKNNRGYLTDDITELGATGPKKVYFHVSSFRTLKGFAVNVSAVQPGPYSQCKGSEGASALHKGPSATARELRHRLRFDIRAFGARLTSPAYDSDL